MVVGRIYGHGLLVLMCLWEHIAHRMQHMSSHAATCTHAPMRLYTTMVTIHWQSNQHCISCRVTSMCRASVRGSRTLGGLVAGCMFAAIPRRLLGLGAHPVLSSLFPHHSVRPVACEHYEQAMTDVCVPAMVMSSWPASVRSGVRARTPEVAL